MTIKGQDWASYQSDTPATSGLDFAFIKATEGTSYTNPRMASQAAHARAAGLVVGFYHFLHAGSIAAQAEWFVNEAASQDGDVLFVDWETVAGGSTASCAEKDAFIAEVCRLRGSSHRIGLYCNRDFWINRDTTSNAGDALWIADYVTAGKPRIDANWLFHQFTSTPVDTNVGAFTSRAVLKAWATKATPPTTPTPLETPVESNTDMLSDLTNNLLHIGSLTEVDAKGQPVVHGAGYYLAHTHYDAGEIHDQCARIEDGQKALTDKVDALTEQVTALAALAAKLAPQS